MSEDPIRGARIAGGLAWRAVRRSAHLAHLRDAPPEEVARAFLPPAREFAGHVARPIDAERVAWIEGYREARAEDAAGD